MTRPGSARLRVAWRLPTSPAPSTGRSRGAGDLADNGGFLEALSRADCNAGERRFGKVDGKLRFGAHELREAAKETAAPYKHDSSVRDVGRQLGRGGFE